MSMWHGHIPRKRFGQNFLIAPQVIAAIIASINPQSEQHIVEIGPGQGALTNGLVASNARIDAIEIDRDLADHLQAHFIKFPNFKLHGADILNFDLHTLYDSDTTQKLRLVGNLPYNISSPLLFKLFTDMTIISDMHFMLQREVAERLTANPGTKEYGRMSVMAQYYCAIQIVLDVPPDAFDPAPKVDSSVVRFVPHKDPSVMVRDQHLLQRVTTLAFNQRRKTIANSLKSVITATELQQLQIDPMLRAENLTLQNYAQITDYLQDNKGL